MNFEKITEGESHYQDLEKMPVSEILRHINNEDKTVAWAVEKALPCIERLVNQVVQKLQSGGRLFYIGAGTSGRMGILDASECPPTFGVSPDLVIGLIAGGDSAIRKAVEFAEDDLNQGFLDLKKYDISTKDIVIGIAASGTTPYVIGALNECKKNGILTGAITCNEGSPLALQADFPVVVVVGPEFVTGSSRMKAGTAQKLVLNMISTSTMIQLQRIKGNKMVDMQLSNHKLIHRGVRMLMDELQISQETAQQLLETHKSVRNALIAYNHETHR
jgi:N-acetylmuramic acid 6-phosphate etherase